MTDEGQFELLATAILAKSSPLYSSVLHLGINAEGKTVTSPVDGFCRVPGSSPPHFVLFQHTTTARSKLRDKWLSTNDKSLGDLIKAGREAAILRHTSPNAVFTVVLSTNQCLPSGSTSVRCDEQKSLLYDIIGRAEELGVEVDVWEQSRYTRFLDTDRDGQYLRWRYLGTDAQMLSCELLAGLSKASLATYANEQFTSPDTWIRRAVVDEILRLRGGNGHLAVVLGESGYGKSAVSYQVLAEHIGAGGVGFYMPATIAADSLTIEEAVASLLHRLYPSLLSEEVRHLPGLVPGEPIVIVVDDVKTISSPQSLVRRIKGWAMAPYLIVAPMWTRFWTLAEPTWEKRHQSPDSDSSLPSGTPRYEESGVSVHSLGCMTRDESLEAIRAATQGLGLALSEIEMLNISGMLGHDPWCIGAWARMTMETPAVDARKSATASVSVYVDHCLDDMTSADGRLLPVEFGEALTQLTLQMLRRRCINPHWRDITSWLHGDDDSVEALRALCRSGQLCRLDSDGAFRFRHDRILSHFAVEGLCEILSSKRAEDREVLFDPYYSWWTAEALLRAPQSDEFIDEMLDTLPFAVTLTISHIGIPATAYERMIVEKGRAWVHPLRYAGHIPESVKGAVANSFIFADSPAVLDIVTHNFGLEVPWLGDFARLRNGDAEAGVRYAGIAGIGEGNYGFWEQLVEHALRRHHDRLVKDLIQALTSAQDERQIKGALVLAGFFALPELHDAISGCWRSIPQKVSYLLEALWAALRCSTTYECDNFLSELGDYWAEMPDVEEPDRDGWRQHIAGRLGRAMARGATPGLVDWLLHLSQHHQQLQGQVAFMCGLFDFPAAVDYAVRYLAANEGDPSQRGFEHHWGHFDHPRLSVSSVERLRALWGTPDNDPQTRKMAFSLWRENVDCEATNVLPLLQQVDSAMPYHTEAVIARARMGDKACVPFLLDIIRNDTCHFCVAHHVWCDDLRNLASHFLASFAATIPCDFTGGKLNEHYALAELLMRIPETDAEALLLDNWDHLRFSSLFVQSALFVGTPVCVSMADRSINEFPGEVNPLEHMDFHFGFGLVRWSDRPPLTLERLKLAGRYLDRLDDTAGPGYVRACCQYGGSGLEWARDHAPSTAWDWYRKNHCPTDKDITERLSDLTGQHPNSTQMYVDDFVKRDEEHRLVSVLGNWLREAPAVSWRRIQVAATILEMIGNRSDLAMLDVPPDTGEGAWAAREADEIRAGVSFSVRLRSLR